MTAFHHHVGPGYGEGPYAELASGARRYSLRPPRAGDYASWRDVRLEHARVLAPAFGSSQRRWEQESTPEAWIERIAELRAAARHDTALPAVVVEHVAGGERVIGELGVCAVDPLTRTGEFYAWAVAGDPVVVPWAASVLVLESFDGPLQLRRVVAPVAVDNPGPSRALRRMGWTLAAERAAYREYDERPATHGIWVLENELEVRRALEAVAGR